MGELREYKFKLYNNSPGDMEVEHWTQEDWNNYRYEKYDPPLDVTIYMRNLPQLDQDIKVDKISSNFYVLNLSEK